METEIKGDKLIITIDISDKAVAAAEMSSSGRNKLVATTAGFVRLNDKLQLSLNLIAKEKKKEKKT
jgi:hypothetical protein